MKQLIPMDEYGIFADMHDTARANSLLVAQVFEKEHFHVLRDIENVACSKDFRESNFGLSYYVSDQGKRLPCVDMTRDGLIFLVMGYRGKRAAAFKEAYIKRFNEMEKTLRALVSARQQFPLLTEHIKILHDRPKPYHFSNECDLLNRLVIGMTAKQFRAAQGVPEKTSIRPYLSDSQINMLDALQRVDVGLLLAFPDYEQRKRSLEWYRNRMNGVGQIGA